MHSEECDAAQTHQLFHLRSYQKPSKELQKEIDNYSGKQAISGSC